MENFLDTVKIDFEACLNLLDMLPRFMIIFILIAFLLSILIVIDFMRLHKAKKIRKENRSKQKTK